MIKDFDFILPKELIAKKPLPRGNARLLYYNGLEKKEGLFSDLAEFLKPGDLLVFNNSKVIPALLTTQEGIKINLIKRLNDKTWSILGKPRKKILLGMEMIFSKKLKGIVVAKDDLDQITFNLTGEDFYQELEKCGSIPLPPYMKRLADESDKENYQTVLAKVPGAVAAPTAGLHFSEEFLFTLQKQGIDFTTITLEVGGGTFLPVTSETLAGHKMHSEAYWIAQEAADKINQTKKDGNRVIAVGTSSARTLESGRIFCQGELFPHTNETDLFIQMGFNFQVIDGLITNFHLPRSTLFVLVASYLRSLDKAQELYNYAIEEKYRFFSYGDACFFTQENG